MTSNLLNIPEPNGATSGLQALARGAWQDALAIFQAAVSQQETPEALEGLGMATYWLGDGSAAIASRERAYVLYRESGDMRSAGRIATFLSLDYLDFRGEIFVADGWLQRAKHLLEGIESCTEQGWLALLEAQFALLGENDVAAARKHCIKAAELGRQLGYFDLEMMALAYDGFALVRDGSILQGMRQIDEAAAAALKGEMHDLTAIGATCCTLIYACESVKDYDRAAQWCRRVQEFTRLWNTLPLLSVCRIHYGGILMWRGAWNEAEEELRVGTQDLTGSRPPAAMIGVAQLAELRRRQGRIAEAESLLLQIDMHPMSLLIRAEIALDKGDNATAAELAERFLRHIFPDDPSVRTATLELLVRSTLALGDSGKAGRFQKEARLVGNTTVTPPLQATCASIDGLVAAAGNDFEGAKRFLEDAVYLYHGCGAPYETARARVDLARLLINTGRNEGAVQELTAALSAFEKLGAPTDAGRIRMLLSELGQPSRVSGETATLLAPGLTERELEVLRLIARGMSNREIAQQLFLSVRTVERHITNIYGKIDIKNKAEATAFALRSGIV